MKKEDIAIISKGLKDIIDYNAEHDDCSWKGWKVMNNKNKKTTNSKNEKRFTDADYIQESKYCASLAKETEKIARIGKDDGEDIPECGSRTLCRMLKQAADTEKKYQAIIKECGEISKVLDSQMKEAVEKGMMVSVESIKCDKCIIDRILSAANDGRIEGQFVVQRQVRNSLMSGYYKDVSRVFKYEDEAEAFWNKLEDKDEKKYGYRYRNVYRIWNKKFGSGNGEN